MSRFNLRAPGFALALTSVFALGFIAAGSTAHAQMPTSGNTCEPVKDSNGVLMGMMCGSRYTPVNRATTVADTSSAPAAAERSDFRDTPADTSSAPGGHALQDTVLVQGDPEANDHRQRPPLAARAFVMQDNNSYYTRGEWIAHGWSTDSFEAVEQSNQHFCSVTGRYIAHAADLLRRYAAQNPKIAALQVRYQHMADKDIKAATRVGTVANVIYGGLGFVTGPITGAMTTAGAIGSQAELGAWNKMMHITADAGLENQELNGLHVEFNEMSLEVYGDYFGLVNGYCVSKYGNKPAPTQ